MSRLKELVVDVAERLQSVANRDIQAELQRQALVRTAEFIVDQMPTARPVRARNFQASTLALIDAALAVAPVEGLVLEFGVASGTSLRHIQAQRRAHGFDSFRGLPEDWIPGAVEAGHFAQPVPDVNGAELHVGWFTDTLPEFVAAHPEPIAFLHLDADLYSSTDTILRLTEQQLAPGAVLVFDEYFNYPGWEQHEHKAFVEFIERTGYDFRYVAFNAIGYGVLVQLGGQVSALQIPLEESD